MSLFIPELLRKLQLREIRWLKGAHTAGPCQSLKPIQAFRARPLHLPPPPLPSGRNKAARTLARTAGKAPVCAILQAGVYTLELLNVLAIVRKYVFQSGKIDFTEFASIAWVTSITDSWEPNWFYTLSSQGQWQTWLLPPILLLSCWQEIMWEPPGCSTK